MALSMSKPSSISALSLVSVLLFALFSSNSATVIGEICSRTIDPSFCNNVLNKPGVAEDLPTLAAYVINLALNNTSNAMNLIKSLFNNATDPKLKQHYGMCAARYDDAFTDLDLNKQYLSSRDYASLSRYASAALKEFEDCDSEQISDPSSLPRNNKDLEKLSDIIVVIATILSHKNN